MEILDSALARARSENSTALVSISGPPGVGKTSLALAWLHRHIEDCPDGQLYADLEGHRDAPAGPDRVLPRFLQALGVAPDHVPADLPGQTAHFRTVTTGRRVAVLCDNALPPARRGSAGGRPAVVSRSSRSTRRSSGPDSTPAVARSVIQAR